MSTEHFPDIIREAATSPLGILALIILLLGSLAVAFFGKSSEKVRLTVWLMAFGGALLFGFAVVRQTGPEQANRQEPIPPPPPPDSPNEPIDESEEEPDPPERRRGTIQIGYAGDVYGCSLPLTIGVGDRSFQPQGTLVPMNGVPLGRQRYTISGQILCPTIGTCSVDSEGTIEVAAGQTYFLVWQNTTFGECEAILQHGS